MVGGTIWLRIASTVTPASSPPAPPSKCPVIDFVELTQSLYACSPNARFGPAADHHIRGFALDQFERIADGVRARRAGRGRRRIRALRARADRHVPRSQVHDSGRNEEGRDAARPFFEQRFMLPLDDF